MKNNNNSMKNNKLRNKIYINSVLGFMIIAVISMALIIGFQLYNLYDSPKSEGLNEALLITSNNNVYGQDWFKTWGGSNNDFGYGVAVDSSNNIYITGRTDSFGEVGDAFLIKYDSSGRQLWNKTWGGSNVDAGYGIAVNSSSNIYITGYTGSFGLGPPDAFLINYDSSGTQLWNRTWGGSNWEYGYGVAVDSIGNVYVTGYTQNFGAGLIDVFLVKYNSSGIQLWNRTWGGSDWDYGYGIAVDLSNNIYITGRTESFGEVGDAFLVKYDSSGTRLWNKTWGGSSPDYGSGIAADLSSNIYITGHTSSFGLNSTDAFLVKYNSSGAMLWNKTWGGFNSDESYGIAVDSSNNIYITGYTASFGTGTPEAFLVKYDSSGTRLGIKIWGGSNSDYGYGIAVDSSSNIYIIGKTDSYGAGYDDVFLVKYLENPTQLIPGFSTMYLILGIGLMTIYIKKTKHPLNK